MKAIWKFYIPVNDVSLVEMPKNAEIISAAVIFPATISVWAKVETTEKKVFHQIAVVGTGHPSERVDGMRFVATCFDIHSLVWHVFDGGEK
jgi:hypothetical protein